ncbi:MAG: hypothetical protein ACYC1U_06890 [Candidatus Aquicultorales bacterium]
MSVRIKDRNGTAFRLKRGSFSGLKTTNGLPGGFLTATFFYPTKNLRTPLPEMKAANDVQVFCGPDLAWRGFMLDPLKNTEGGGYDVSCVGYWSTLEEIFLSRLYSDTLLAGWDEFTPASGAVNQSLFNKDKENRLHIGLRKDSAFTVGNVDGFIYEAPTGDYLTHLKHTYASSYDATKLEAKIYAWTGAAWSLVFNLNNTSGGPRTETLPANTTKLKFEFKTLAAWTYASADNAYYAKLTSVEVYGIDLANYKGDSIMKDLLGAIAGSEISSDYSKIYVDAADTFQLIPFVAGDYPSVADLIMKIDSPYNYGPGVWDDNRLEWFKRDRTTVHYAASLADGDYDPSGYSMEKLVSKVIVPYKTPGGATAYYTEEASADSWIKRMGFRKEKKVGQLDTTSAAVAQAVARAVLSDAENLRGAGTFKAKRIASESGSSWIPAPLVRAGRNLRLRNILEDKDVFRIAFAKYDDETGELTAHLDDVDESKSGLMLARLAMGASSGGGGGASTVVGVSGGGSGGASAFIDLADVPASYAGQAGKAAVVNGTEDGLEFGDAGTNLIIEEGDVQKTAAAEVLDFKAEHFDVTISPAGEANIDLRAGSIGGDVLEWNGTIWLPKIPVGSAWPSVFYTGKWFYRSDRNVVYARVGSAWMPLFGFADIQMYVDKTNGTDDSSHGFGIGANAFKTVAFAISQVPPENAGNVYIDHTAENYDETVTVGGKKFAPGKKLYIRGTRTVLESKTAGAGTRPGLFSTVNRFQYGKVVRTVAGAARVNKWVEMTSGAADGEIIMVDYDDATNIRPIGRLLVGAPAQNDTFNIVEPGTQITKLIFDSAQINVVVEDVQLNMLAGTQSDVFGANSDIYFRRCFFNFTADSSLWIDGNAKVSFDRCHLTYMRLFCRSHASVKIGGCKHSYPGHVGRSIQADDFAVVYMGDGTIVDGQDRANSVGLLLSGAATCNINGNLIMTGSSSFKNTFRNLTTGVSVGPGCVAVNTNYKYALFGDAIDAMATDTEMKFETVAPPTAPVDNQATFQTWSVGVGDKAIDYDDQTSAIVNGITSETQLALTTNAAWDAGLGTADRYMILIASTLCTTDILVNTGGYLA